MTIIHIHCDGVELALKKTPWLVNLKLFAVELQFFPIEYLIYGHTNRDMLKFMHMNTKQHRYAHVNTHTTHKYTESCKRVYKTSIRHP